MPDDDISSHRTRTNRWPEPAQQSAPDELVRAVEAVYDAVEDRT